MSINWLAWSALALFALSFASAADGLGLDRLLRGYLRQYRLHHRLALLATALILGHGAHQWLSLPAADRGMLFDLRDRAMLLAWLALLSLLLLTLAAILHQHWRRRYWLRLHWLLLPTLLLALAHAWCATRPMLRAWLPLFALPLLPWLGKYLPAGLWPRFSGHIACARLQHLATDVVLLEIDAAALPRSFCAGQIVQLRFLGLPGLSRLWHPFSVASCQREAKLRLLVRQTGLDTQQLQAAGAQLAVAVRGPYQEWQADFSRPQLWLAGGIGIAPFVGMWHCRTPQDGQPVQLLHFASASDQLDYAPLFDCGCNRLHYRRFDSAAGQVPDWGQLTPFLQQRQADEAIFLSGPPGFIAAASRYLRQANVPAHAIHAEQLTPWER